LRKISAFFKNKSNPVPITFKEGEKRKVVQKFSRNKLVLTSIFLAGFLCGSFMPFTLYSVWAQETDVTQTPNFEQAGIKKSLIDQVGDGHGNIALPTLFNDPMDL